MNRLFASIIICLFVLLGNISVQSKTFKIVDHITTEHTVPAHHHHQEDVEHNHHSNKTEHKHHIEISLLTVCMALPAYRIVFIDSLTPSTYTDLFFSINELDIRSFTSSIFRPPIA